MVTKVKIRLLRCHLTVLVFNDGTEIRVPEVNLFHPCYPNASMSA